MVDAAVTIRIVAGNVDRNGKILSGVGFDVNPVGAPGSGRYIITFRPPFNNFYGGSVTQVGFVGGESNTLDGALIYNITNGSMFVLTGGVDGKIEARDFTFIVAGV